MSLSSADAGMSTAIGALAPGGIKPDPIEPIDHGAPSPLFKGSGSGEEHAADAPVCVLVADVR